MSRVTPVSIQEGPQGRAFGRKGASLLPPLIFSILVLKDYKIIIRKCFLGSWEILAPRTFLSRNGMWPEKGTGEPPVRRRAPAPRAPQPCCSSSRCSGSLLLVPAPLPLSDWRNSAASPPRDLKGPLRPRRPGSHCWSWPCGLRGRLPGGGGDCGSSARPQPPGPRLPFCQVGLQ